MTDNIVHGVRNHSFYELTRSICPKCRRLIDAQVIIRDGAVFLRKYCPDHGWHEALFSSDAEWHLESLKYNGPGAIPFKFATDVNHGCPADCGLCPEHQQHTCLALVEITTRCNLSCPICFADAGGSYDLSVSQVEYMLDRLVETEGNPQVIQISGGEPTLHPQLMEIMAEAKKRNIKHIMLNTNGIKLAADKDFTQRLAEFGTLVYLQFDGFTSSTHQKLRGQDLSEIKKQALENIAEAGMHAILVATVVKDVNDSEIGDILQFGLAHSAVYGVSYQPVTFAGRCLNHCDPLNRVTLPDVIHALEEQTDGLFRVSDFRPVPCPHPTCSACSYAYINGDQVTPLARITNMDDYVLTLTNSIAPDLNENLFMIQVHGFMDEHTFDVKRLMKCCVHELLPNGHLIPFCAYNNLGYRQQ